MTEAEWLACVEPGQMLDHLGGGWGERRERQFACGCLRRIWAVLPKKAHRDAIEVCERFLAGQATAGRLERARRAADRTDRGLGDALADYAGLVTASLCAPAGSFVTDGVLEDLATIAADAWHDDARPWHVVYAAEQAAQCALLRDIVGNPFRPVAFDLAWATELVRSLAAGVVEARRLPEGTFDPERLAVLADALEDAGCADAAILSHLRDPGPHVRGCWVLTLLLGHD